MGMDGSIDATDLDLYPESPATESIPEADGSLILFPKKNCHEQGIASSLLPTERQWILRVIEISSGRRQRMEDDTAPTDWAMLKEQYQLEKEIAHLQKRQVERREWFKQQIMGLPEQWRAFRKAELLEGLLNGEKHIEITDVENLTQKKNQIFTQHGLPVEYLQADNLSRHLQAINQVLMTLCIDQQQGLATEVPAEKIEELKALKPLLYEELEENDRLLKQHYPLAWLIIALRWILERI